MRNVLVANRGEIAVRVIRACRDAGLGSVAVYADTDRDSLAARLADQAYALGGQTAAETYLRVDKMLEVASRTGADAVHPGYGFLSENADFAEAVLAAGLTWIGPTPEAIRNLGDKIIARKLAERAGAPLVPGTTAPAAGPQEAVTFARRYGLPIAIKAAYGGGGRGLKVARTFDEIEAQFESATREAVAAFGRGECFLERYLDRPRHVEAQVLADQHGNVVVVGTRDCSLQRRHQKLVEEAPAPFLTPQQRVLITDSAKAICREAGYSGAGTVEYLVASDGTVAFLEVNTRLQVEHPVTEQTTGIDLVREQFRIADGETLRWHADPEPHGHAIEFRINGEDPGRGFLPAPGVVTALRLPTGPGVRVDEGVEVGSVVDGNFDSLLAKIIVTGETRTQALERARRALDETVLEGLATVLPFHRRVVRDEAFTAAPFRVHTRWIETEWSADLPPYAGSTGAAPDPEPRTTVVVEVDGKRLEVSLPADFAGGTAAVTQAGRPTARRRPGGRTVAAGPGGDALSSPMQGTIVAVLVADGDVVAQGDLIVVLEAMKMEQPLHAHRAGVVSGLNVTVGEVVPAGAVICTLADAPADRDA
ncbi:MAG TPA: biotin carboxylase N-terminal domain-containing protein [Micromonosporaceae bacterium]|nr:biotin carboxylase N-terminal domain-containing protein [Micromonosporaceae bacterium]